MHPWSLTVSSASSAISSRLPTKFEEHDRRFDAIDAQLTKHDGELAAIKDDVAGLRADLPRIVTDAVRLSASTSTCQCGESTLSPKVRPAGSLFGGAVCFESLPTRSGRQSDVGAATRCVR